MKNVKRHTSRRSCPAYPNAASRSFYLHRMLDMATAIASAMGLAAALIFIASIT